MADKMKTGAGTPIRDIRHDETRPNIPTAELESFAADEEKRPTIVRYPRDTTLDPQLVWKGKDEQDASDLAVPAVPIYIGETIDPLRLVEELRAESEGRQPEAQLDLFGSFTDLSFSEKVDFYHHPGRWSNRMILGDSLLVMTSLAEKEGLRGQVQTIYIDPPYGIKFGSNWQVSTRDRDVRDGKSHDLTRQPEQVKAYRDTWELGVNSYLSYLRDRLVSARDLLTESGSVFVQIGDENVHLVRSLLDEVFGRSNLCLQIAYKKTTGAGSPSGTTDLPPAVFDYLLWYARDRESVKYRRLYKDKEFGAEGATQYRWVEDQHGLRRQLSPGEAPSSDERLFAHDNMTSQSSADTTVFPVDLDARTYRPGTGGWKTNAAGMDNLRAARRLMGLGNTLRFVRYLDDFRAAPRTNLWEDTVTSGFGDPKTYVVQTLPRVIERCLLMTTDPGDLVLDPTCGSGTTAYVAEQWGRRWITIDTSRVALALARARLMAAK